MRHKRAKKVKTKTIQFIEKIVFQIDNLNYHEKWYQKSEKDILNFKIAYIDRFNSDHQIVSHELLTLHRSIKGVASKRIRDLYILLGLEKIAMKILEGEKTYEHPKIIRELAQMRIIESVTLIKNCLDFKKDKEIQLEASVALLMLQLNNPMEGIEHLSFMTPGQKLYFIESCKKLDPKIIPDFTKGFLSNNIHVVEISLILCEYFRQSYSTEIVSDLQKTSNSNIIFAATNLIIKSCNLILINELMKNLHTISDIRIQVSIIKNIKFLDNIELINDLQLVINNPMTLDNIKLEAIRSACRLAEKFDQTFTLDRIHIVDEKTEKMFLHAQEKLI